MSGNSIFARDRFASWLRRRCEQQLARERSSLHRLPSDVLQALATFVPLSDMLVLLRCSRQLNTQLSFFFDRLFVVTHLEENWAQAQLLPSSSFKLFPNQPELRLLEVLFGEADKRGDWRVYSFIEVDRQSILNLTQCKDLYNEYEDGYTPYYIVTGKDENVRDRFANWLRHWCSRCEQLIAEEAHAYGNTTDFINGVTSDL
jgi:hypothetical protein